MVEGTEHFREQRRCLAALISCAEGEPDCLQSDIGSAAFVRDWKTISAEAELAATAQTDADRAGAGDNDGAVRTPMGTETRGHSVAENGCE